MSQSLDFSLPQAPARRGSRLLAVLTFACAALSLGLLVALIVLGDDIGAQGGTPSEEIEQKKEKLQQIAQDLERRTLYLQAADVWGEYSTLPGLEPAEVASAVYFRGKNLLDGGDYALAARVLTEYEHLEVSADDRRHAAELILECLSALGKEEARESLLKAYTSFDSEAEETTVARVSGESITLEDLRRQLADQLEAFLTAQDPTLSSAEARQRAEDMARERLKDPKVREQVLQQAISTEVLYREALARKLADAPANARAVAEFRKSYLAQKVVQQSVDEALRSITPGDLRDHYQAHLEDYVRKPAVEFSYQAFPNEATARSALDALVDSDFQKGASPAIQGEPVPGIGRSAEATAHLLALDEGQVGDRAIEIGGEWYVFRCDRKREKRQLTFEEAESRVRADVARRKRAEAAEKLQSELLKKFSVDVLADELKKAAEDEPTGDEKSEEASDKEEDPDSAASSRGGDKAKSSVET